MPLKGISASAAAIGSAVTVTALGPGNNGQEPVVTRVHRGEAARPLAPAQVRGALRPDGALVIEWTHRSRRGFAWIDAVDVPVDADFGGYRISATGAAGTADHAAIDPALVVTAPELAALGAGPLTIDVRQAGAFGLSRPATIIINI